MVYVKWKYFPASENSWIVTDSINEESGSEEDSGSDEEINEGDE